jgi:hypothetical protein
MNVIQKYLLPKEVDFNHALQKQADASRNSVLDLANYCMKNDRKALMSIVDDEHNSRALKSKNMKELLNVFITPYDKESIYRMIVQLDWIVLSVKHLAIEIVAYQIKCPEYYKPIFTILIEMIEALLKAFTYLPQKELGKILLNIESIHNNYDETTKKCALAAVRHLEEDEVKVYLAHKEILNQLKEVSKRIHVSANTLEDMAMKIV